MKARLVANYLPPTDQGFRGRVSFSVREDMSNTHLFGNFSMPLDQFSRVFPFVEIDQLITDKVINQLIIASMWGKSDA